MECIAPTVMSLMSVPTSGGNVVILGTNLGNSISTITVTIGTEPCVVTQLITVSPVLYQAVCTLGEGEGTGLTAIVTVGGQSAQGTFSFSGIFTIPLPSPSPPLRLFSLPPLPSTPPPPFFLRITFFLLFSRSHYNLRHVRWDTRRHHDNHGHQLRHRRREHHCVRKLPDVRKRGDGNPAHRIYV